jgi:hypothetical protein
MPTANVLTVYCVQAATGVDGAVNQAIANLVEEIWPDQFGGNLLDGIRAAPNVIAAIDAARSDPDDLYITTGTAGGMSNAIWPSAGSHGSVQAGQSFTPNLSIDFENSQNLSRWDYDSGSDDDLLGSVTMLASEQGSGEVAKLARSMVEGSAYYVIYRVD